jgi:hypothetical protein
MYFANHCKPRAGPSPDVLDALANRLGPHRHPFVFEAMELGGCDQQVTGLPCKALHENSSNSPFSTPLTYYKLVMRSW